jgi:hypothetical protein
MPKKSGTGYAIPDENPLATAQLEMQRRMVNQERPNAVMVASLLSQVRLAIANLNTGVATAFAALVAGGITTPGGITVGGIIRSPATYSNSITSSFRNVFVTSVDGSFGFNLSSRRFKQDIEDFVPDAATIAQLRLVTFRYIAAVELEGDAAEIHVGLIAEEVHDLGLHWLVEYEDGQPIGIKFHLVAMAMLAVAQDHEKRLQAAGL